jgi:glycosyltransferase involved in cell wall biosynthesis
MAEVLFIVEEPTPQRTPVLDSIVEHGVDLLTLFHRQHDALRGWGPIEPRHPWQNIPAGLIRSCAFVARQVLAPDLRILCCFGYSRPANLLAVVLARIRGVQIVTRTDSNWLHERRRPPARRLLKRAALQLLYGQRTRVWTIGTENDRYWAAMGLTNRTLIPFELPRPPIGTPEHGRAFRDRHRLGTGMVVLYVGMLEPHKGTDTLIEAFRAMPDEKVRLVVVGRGSLDALVQAASVEDTRIIRCGPLAQEQLGPVFAAADLLVLPSRQEAWGYVVNEAQANGVRVAVSDAVGCATDSVDDAHGYVFRAGDAPQLTAVLRAAADDHARGGIGVAARQPYNPAPDMIADLVRLGVRLRGPDACAGSSSMDQRELRA